MRKLLGLVLAAIGLVFGYAAYHNAPTDREDQLAEVTRILTNPGVDTSGSSGTIALNRTKPAPLPATSLPKAAKITDAGSVQVATAETTAAAPVPSTTWQTSVSAEAVRPGATAAVTSASPGDNSARRELVRSLQTELKRVGCFSGDATGNWTSKSKRALAAFIERVNASLPVEQPDYIQLTLLQGQPGAVCGRDCPKGQAQTGDGRCLPSAILAQVETKTSAEVAEPPASSAQAATASDASAAQQRIETASAAPKEELPWANKTVRRVDQLPGRMSVGAASAAIAQPDRQPSNDGRSLTADRLARLETRSDLPQPVTNEPSVETSVLNDEEQQSAVPAEDDSATAADISPQANKRAPQQFAALTTPPSPQRAAVRLAAPKARAFVPRSYFARAQRAARPQKPRYFATAPRRSVQNLFTHPLGRM